MVVNSGTFASLVQLVFVHAHTVLEGNTSFLARPTTGDETVAAKIFFHEPLFHLKTSAHVDIEKFLNQIARKYIGMFCCVLQTYFLHFFSIW